MDIRSYGLPTLLATCLHVVVLGALLNHWIGDVEPERRSVPHIQARMIDLESFSQQVAPPAPAPTPDDKAEQRQAAEKAAQENARREAETARQQELKKQKAAEEAQRQKQVAEQKRKADEAAKKKQAELEAKKKAEALAKRKAEEAAKKQAQAKKEAEQKAKAEAAAKAKAEAQAKAKAEAAAKAQAEAAAKAKAAEQARQAAQQRAESVVGDIQGYMQALIQRNWLVPKTARNGMEAVVAIRLLGNGEVDQASIYKSSGDAAFDNSALQAVYRTERFERVAEVDPILFERRLRSIHIVFRPEGLRW
ncbi:TolA protein [Marinobacterium lacunae]|uniref:TolA protein n=1 Tax=Marinobacterium lacunae TaxID=1232683 RepID=A0A081FU51_9GAMM|nr:cell envelope integrity protein TolA [Marinobacterium lacunae]KEA62056.1 TolA protein [Marinobacterium lacunae]